MSVPVNPDFKVHLPLLDKVYSEGGSDARYCVEAGVNKQTVKRWLKEIPEFKEAYDRAILKSEAYWDELPLSMMEKGLMFNYGWWRLQYQNRFNLGKERINIRGKNPDEQIEIYKDAVSEGNMHSEQYVSRVTCALAEKNQPAKDEPDSKLSSLFEEHSLTPEEIDAFKKQTEQKAKDIALEAIGEIVKKRDAS
jgi:hypothetical protein